jgi:hypothetical protein
MTDHGENRRRSERILLQVNVLLSSELPGNKSYRAQAFTLVVSAHGGLLEAPVRVTVNQKITLTNQQSRKAVGCRVLRVEGPVNSNFKIAFEFDEYDAHFWPVAFPPASWIASKKATNAG